MENWAEMESVYTEDVKTKGWLSDVRQSGRQSDPADLEEGGYLFTSWALWQGAGQESMVEGRLHNSATIFQMLSKDTCLYKM